MILKFITFTLLFLHLSSCLDNASGSRRPEAQAPIEENDPQDTEADFNLEDTLPTMLYKDRGTESLPLLAIRKALLRGELPTGYYLYPTVEQTYTSEVISQVHKYSNCGLSSEILTIKDAIADCLDKNPANATWDATKNGTSGEADWKLVTVTSEDLIIWQDQRTGLLWTSAIKEIDFDQAREQTCVQTFQFENIQWKLPNRNEFLLADIDGARFVLDETDNTYWTETAATTLKAWAIKQDTGVLSDEEMTTNLSGRCVGVVLSGLL